MFALTNRLALSAVSLLLPAVCGGCATCINGTTQDIPVSSSPGGATVLVDGVAHPLDTPCTLKLARNRDHIVVVSKPGYCEDTRNISRKPTGTTRGNIWIGGLIGWGVDTATGADNDLVPDHIDAVLRSSPDSNSGELSARPGANVWQLSGGTMKSKSQS